MLEVVGFYKFVKISYLKKNQKVLLETLKKKNIRGTIIISKEGINGTISGKAADIKFTINNLKKTLKFKEFNSNNVSKSSFQPFHKPKVKIKNEVVPMNLILNKRIKKKDSHVDPIKWNKLIKEKDTVLIDARKPFEYDVGTFKGAINPDVDNFRDFPKYLKKLKKDRPIAMFCTGGIRCEKATSLLRNKGYENVYHLKGGILKYLENISSNNLYEGECYVFDERVALDNNLKKGSYSICHACGMPLSIEDKTHILYIEGIQCHLCEEKFTDADRARFSERQKQIEDKIKK